MMEAFIFRKSCLFEYFEVSLRCVDVRVFLIFFSHTKIQKKCRIYNFFMLTNVLIVNTLSDIYQQYSICILPPKLTKNQNFENRNGHFLPEAATCHLMSLVTAQKSSLYIDRHVLI